MRPLELRLVGFRSYRTERTISFRDLDLVAIIGDTGAGKSSLLEAITWALYGASSWSKKSSAELLAHNARRMTVALEFEAAEETWRVTRTFGSGGGAELVCLSNPAIAKIDGVRAVDPEIERILGLNYDVFCSCVLLPQGKFERLLKATRGEKTDTLKSILRLEALGEMRERADRLARSVGEREREILTARGRFREDPGADAAAAAARMAVLGPQVDALASAQAELLRLAEARRGFEERRRDAVSAAGRLRDRRGARSATLRALAGRSAALGTELLAAVEARDVAFADRSRADAEHRAAVAGGVDAAALATHAGAVAAARGALGRRSALVERIAADEHELGGVDDNLSAACAALAAAEAVLEGHDAARLAADTAARAASERARELEGHAQHVATAAAPSRPRASPRRPKRRRPRPAPTY